MVEGGIFELREELLMREPIVGSLVEWEFGEFGQLSSSDWLNHGLCLRGLCQTPVFCDLVSGSLLA